MGKPFSTYYGVLRRVHQHIRPSRYLEIGVHQGHSLAFVQPGTCAVGVDPEPMLNGDAPANCSIVACTSDDFFLDEAHAEHRAKPFDLVFVDGLHLFEQTLADILRAEQNCHHQSVILVHDTLPMDAETSTREHSNSVWSGDVWKAIVALNRYRPDLHIHTIAADPTGLTIITGLNPHHVDLPPWFEVAVDELMPLGYDDLVELGMKTTLNVVPPIWPAVAPLLPDEADPDTTLLREDDGLGRCDNDPDDI
ncbi:MAG: class I SAM-dependent methyltransferase [Acidimicrobiales bacterium]|nr:class I SAM-dependent methyltransferase [Acidimicrobiales bacterium]